MGEGRRRRSLHGLVICAVVLAATVGSTPPAQGDGTETLGPPSIDIADGSGVAIGGLGMQDIDSGSLPVDVPAGASVLQVLLYWQGLFVEAADDTVTVDGVEVSGTAIGGPAPARGDTIRAVAYRADITGLELVGPGSNTLAISGMDFDVLDNGVGVVVVYAEDGASGRIDLRDGMDRAYFSDPEPRRTTVPQAFDVDVAPEDRSAELLLHVAEVGDERPNLVRVRLYRDGEQVDEQLHADALGESAGPEWDAVRLAVAIPAGADEVVVDLVSHDDPTPRQPASLFWVVGAMVFPDAPVTIAEPAIDLVKTAAPTTASPGQEVTYDYVVTNTGAVALSDVTVVDDRLGAIELDVTDLDPDARATGRATYTVVEGDLPGPLVNVATATGRAPDGSEVTDTDDETVALAAPPAIAPAIDLVKTGVLDGDARAGGTVTYAFVITNTGDVALSDITLTDPTLGGALDVADTTLGPAETTTASAVYTLTQDDVDAGQVDNTATTTGRAPDGSEVTDTDDETVALPPAPAITLVKAPNVDEAPVGQVVTYSYVVTNTGNVTLSGITVDDDVLGVILGAADGVTLAPGASTTLSGAHLVTPADGVAGAVRNLATATGTAPDGATVRAEDDAVVGVPGGQVLSTWPLTVVKATSGGGTPPAGAALGFAVACQGVALGDAATFSLPATGGSHTLPVELPDGTVCTVTETDNGGAAGTTVTVAGASTAASAASVTMTEARTVTFDNRYDAAPTAPTGDLPRTGFGALAQLLLGLGWLAVGGLLVRRTPARRTAAGLPRRPG